MMRRWLVLVALVALLVAAGLVDSSARGGRGAVPVTTVANSPQGGGASFVPLALPGAQEARALGPVAPPDGALDATWYCVGGTSSTGSRAHASVLVANAGSATQTATFTVYSSNAKHASTAVKVGGHSVASVSLADVLAASAVAATVEVSGGDVSVSQTVSGPTGVATQPCATSPSAQWYFADGSTVRGADEKLYLFNPFATDAAADITLQTDAGLRQPPAFQGVIVKAHSLVALDMGTVENRRSRVAATITVTTGRLVAGRLQRFSGTGDPGPSGAPPVGLDATPGVPRATGAVVFPFGYKTKGYGETLSVYNPGAGTAEVAVQILLDNPKVNGTMPLQRLQVQPGSTATLDLTSLRALPSAVVHSIVVRTTNGVPITAELWQERHATHGSGLAITSGSPLLARSWALVGLELANSITSVDVVNPGSTPITLHATTLAGAASVPVPALDGVTVPAGGRVRVALSEKKLGQEQVALSVTATGPVAVGWERTSATAAEGSQLSVGIPLSGTTALP